MAFKSIIQNKRFQKIFAFTIFLGWIFLFYQKIDLPNKLPHRPTGEHIWAQIDRASMALTYHMDRAPFFLPRCHQTSNNPEGITAGEFPLIPYSVSILYNTFGFKEIYHRGFVMALSLIGFIMAFFLALKLVDSPFAACFVAILCLASPNIIYYSISFLPDVPALSCMILSLYFLCRNKTGPTRLDLLLFSAFFCLAGLLRISAILPICSVGLAYLICYHKIKLQGIRKKTYFLMAGTIACLIAISWVFYSRWILQHYHIFTFLMEPMPPNSWKEFTVGFTSFLGSSSLFHINGFFYLLITASVLALIFIKRSNKFLLLSACFIYASFFLLFIILFKKGIEHTYYWVPFQLAFFFHIAWIADLITKIKMPVWSKILMACGALIFVNYNAIHIEKNIQQRWNYRMGLYNSYNNLEPYLESLGIHYSDRVATFSDPTFNNTLYLMNRKGWTLDKDEEMAHFHRAFKSCNYTVLNDTSIVHNPELKDYFRGMIGNHQDLYIYKLKEY